MNLGRHWSIELGVYVCPDCGFASPVREWHDHDDKPALHPMDSREKYELVPASRLQGAVERAEDALKLLEERRSPSGQIQMGAARASMVVELLRAIAGGQ